MSETVTELQVEPQPSAAPAPPRRSGWINALIFVGILLVSAYFRFAGLNWDEGQHLHPDERFLTMVTSAVRIPDSLGDYFDSKTSPLNPYNKDFGLFVYGDFPIMFTRFVAEGLTALCAPAKDAPVDATTGIKEPAALTKFMRALGLNQFCERAEGIPREFYAYDDVTLVGRVLSALFDLATLVWVFLIARELYGAHAGLAAMALGGLAAMHLQQAHFYTADTFATTFVVAAVYCAVRAGKTGSWLDFVWSGFFSGLAIASRINVAPVLGIVGLAAIAKAIREWNDRGNAMRVETAIVKVVVAAAVAFVTFRVFMPYAFDGLLSFDERWSGNMTYIQSVANGDDPGGPPGVQWANRTPIVFPWINMVFWGMGLPFGLAAWIGWAFVSWKLLARPFFASRTRTIGEWLRAVALSKHLLIWTWATAYFAWQGIQWVKSMRYQLPVYPFLAIIAGWFVVSAWNWARRAENRSRVLRVSGYAVPVMALIGTLLWATAFTAIYRRPMSRVAASEWMYKNVPTVATLKYTDTSGPQEVHLELPNASAFGDPNVPVTARFSLPGEGELTSITLNNLSGTASEDSEASAPATRLRLQIASDPFGQDVLSEGTLELPAGWAPGSYSLPLSGVRLEAKRDYYFFGAALEGMALGKSSILANEEWDDALPLRLEGRDAYSIYTGFLMQNYADDTPNKIGLLADWLDQSDYIFLTSNRLYGSIPRQPLRYPLTTEYYRLLFTGQLGFDLVAEFTSYPTFGPFEFPDQETTQALGLWPDPTRLPKPGVISVSFPPAEEVFSVYDHPRVLIFKKHADFSLQDVIAKFSQFDLEAAYHGYTPKFETQAPTGLLLDTKSWEIQQDSNTWSELFDRNSILNASPGIGALAWFIVVILIGWSVFPMLFVAAPGLADRGYGLARTLGVLLLSFLIWLPASFKLLPFTREAILLVAIVVAAVGGLIAWPRRNELREFIRNNKRLIVTEEIVFAVAFALFLLIRYGNPDLWHPWKGGEKPMNFAYFNAVVKSQYFPPYDPWFAGGSLTYYYYGYVIVGALTKLLGIVPAIAYNLALPTVYAIAAMGVFSVAHGLAHKFGSRVSGLGFRKQGISTVGNPTGTFRSPPSRIGNRQSAIITGVVAAVFVMLMGNLGELKLLKEQLAEIGTVEFETTMPFVRDLIDAGDGLIKVASGQAVLQFPNDWWYWNATRIIPAPEGEAGPITEFPFFTFTYADLHAHMIALPITVLALGLAVSWLTHVPLGKRQEARGQEGKKQRGSWIVGWLVENWTGLLSLLFGGLTIGALRATNTWDFPTYLGIGVMALAFGTWATESLKDKWTWLRFVVRVSLFVGALLALFAPFARWYVTAYTSIEGWQGSRTEFWPYVFIHAIFLFPIVTYLIVELRRWGWRWMWAAWQRLGEWRGLAAIPIAVAILILLYFALTGVVVLVVAAPIMIGTCALMLRPRLPSVTRFWMLMVLLALMLSVVVEIVVLRGDISRMNTVFKFYYQIWVLLGIAGAVALGGLWPRISIALPRLDGAWQTIAVLLIAGGLIYSPLAARAKINERFSPNLQPGLDGMTYMATAVYSEQGPDWNLSWDYEALTWMQDNIRGTPVVAEGHSRHEYLWQSRVSIYTGLPTIIGWYWHQRQQRTVMPGMVMDLRIRDAADLFGDMSLVTTQKIIERYNVKYIYVGELEKAYYPAEALAKFDQMVTDGDLRVAHQNPGVTIYEVVTRDG